MTRADSQKKNTTGIRKGDSLSHQLFNLIMDDIIGVLKKTINGYKLTTSEIKKIC